MASVLDNKRFNPWRWLRFTRRFQLSYSITEHYKIGVTSEKQNHLIVYSTGAFQVKVLALDLEAAGVTEKKIPAVGITVTAADGNNNPLVRVIGLGALALPADTAANVATIFSSTQGGVGRNGNVNERVPKAMPTSTKFFRAFGTTPNVYRTTVTHSSEAN